jgi:hypothetical protein
MRHRKQRIVETSWVNLNSVTNPKTGRKSYEISVNTFRLASNPKWTSPIEFQSEVSNIRRHFDPAGNRGAKLGTKWKYSNRETAEQLLTIALLKFGV